MFTNGAAWRSSGQSCSSDGAPAKAVEPSNGDELTEEAAEGLASPLQWTGRSNTELHTPSVNPALSSEQNELRQQRLDELRMMRARLTDWQHDYATRRQLVKQSRLLQTRQFNKELKDRENFLIESQAEIAQRLEENRYNTINSAEVEAGIKAAGVELEKE